jgi:hypothetical protein
VREIRIHFTSGFRKRIVSAEKVVLGIDVGLYRSGKADNSILRDVRGWHVLVLPDAKNLLHQVEFGDEAFISSGFGIANELAKAGDGERDWAGHLCTPGSPARSGALSG